MSLTSPTQGHPPDQFRLWPFERRSNSTLRPGPLDEADNPQRTVRWGLSVLEDREIVMPCAHVPCMIVSSLKELLYCLVLQVFDHAEKSATWRVYVEMLEPGWSRV